MDKEYETPALIVGALTFLGCWGYAVSTYGWFLGLGLGWVPAAAIATIVGLLWPLVALGVLAVVVLLIVG